MPDNSVNPIQIQKFLGGIDYPIGKDELIRHAEEQGADENILETLQRLSMDRFNSPNDVSEAAGKIE